ncbi:peptide deformylase [Balneolaceae bacterium ANBcel3]|nr:peptide deformylase [Balneolaceae bacterium ANBcel3]
MPVLPIVTYDDPVLLAKADLVHPDHPDIQTLIDDMFDTMYEADGVGLAAPQVGYSLRLFVVDADVITEDQEEAESYGPRVYINPDIEAIGEETWSAEEGCLSLPEIREKVTRPHRIKIRYQDRDFKTCEEEHEGWFARVLQHEYDHLNGVLFIDYLGALRKRLIKNNLEEIRLGNVKTEYQLAPKAL